VPQSARESNGGIQALAGVSRNHPAYCSKLFGCLLPRWSTAGTMNIVGEAGAARTGLAAACKARCVAAPNSSPLAARARRDDVLGAPYSPTLIVGI
jgi:hypothetical protein